MKAIQMAAFGDSSQLQLTEVDKPKPAANEVLIKVAATTINPLDMKIRKGDMQQFMPVTLPYIPGLDVAGTIEEVGTGVKHLKVGDEVYGSIMGGTYAQYVAVSEHNIAAIPAGLGMDEAVSLAIPVSTSYSLLIDAGNLKAGEKILVHGAAGGVGSVLLQMAKAMGAFVIATATGDGLDVARKLGADEVIDYKAQDFSELVSDVDLVADLVGGETQQKSYSVVKKGGKLISTVMPTNDALAQQAGITAKMINSMPDAKKLEFAKPMIEQGKLKANVAVTMSLENAAQAQDMVSAGGVNGKVVLAVG